MYKFVFVLLAVIAYAFAVPDPKTAAVLATYAAPVVAPAVVTAQSSQVFNRNFNGLVAPIVAAAHIVKSAPLVAAPVNAYYSPYIASPYIASPLTYL